MTEQDDVERDDVVLIQTSGSDANVQCTKCRKIIGSVETVPTLVQHRKDGEAMIRAEVDRMMSEHQPQCPGEPGEPPPESERKILL